MATPIYHYEMPSVAWQLHWWLIAHMDEKQELHGGWRTQASRDLKKDRIWIGRCVDELLKRGLIDTAPMKRYVRVCVDKVTG